MSNCVRLQSAPCLHINNMLLTVTKMHTTIRHYYLQFLACAMTLWSSDDSRTKVLRERAIYTQYPILHTDNSTQVMTKNNRRRKTMVTLSSRRRSNTLLVHTRQAGAATVLVKGAFLLFVVLALGTDALALGLFVLVGTMDDTLLVDTL